MLVRLASRPEKPDGTAGPLLASALPCPRSQAASPRLTLAAAPSPGVELASARHRRRVLPPRCNLLRRYAGHLGGPLGLLLLLVPVPQHPILQARQSECECITAQHNFPDTKHRAWRQLSVTEAPPAPSVNAAPCTHQPTWLAPQDSTSPPYCSASECSDPQATATVLPFSGGSGVRVSRS